MNQKLCKKLRSYALDLTVDKPLRRILFKKVRCGPPGKQYDEFIAFNDPQSTRGVYRRMKREAKRAA